MPSLFLLFSFFACGGPSDETLVDELRVMAILGDTPSTLPGAPTPLTVHSLNPTGAPAELLLWTCTPSPAGCAESTGGQPLSAFTAEAELGVGEASLPGAFGYWALACPVGVCPLFEQVRAAPAPGTDAWREVQALLLNPIDWMDELPLAGTSLARGGPSLSMDGALGAHPIATFIGEVPETLAPEAEVVLEFEVSGLGARGQAWGYGTAGGFLSARGNMRRVEVPSTGRVGLTWVAPTEPGPVEWLVVFTDDAGGQAVWRGGAVVE